MVKGNKFEQNFGYFDASAIFIRRINPTLVEDSLVDNILPCGNLVITGNTFLNNFGCLYLGGSVISLHCI